jgi:hypothetical protein
MESFFNLGIEGIPAKKRSPLDGTSKSSLNSEKSNLNGGLETIKSNFLRFFPSLWAGSLSVLP